MVDEKPKITAVFHDTRGNFTNIVIEKDTTIEELYNKYMEKAPFYVQDQRDFFLCFYAMKLERNDKTKVKDYFRNFINSPTLPEITVVIKKELDC